MRADRNMRRKTNVTRSLRIMPPQKTLSLRVHRRFGSWNSQKSAAVSSSTATPPQAVNRPT